MKTKISEWSTTPASNTDIDGINIAEGCAPSGINDAIRDLMAQVRSWQSGASGDPFNGPMNGTIGATTAYAGAFTTLTTSSTVTLNGGTANGVTYLNGSKVLTSGSALTFDGTRLTALYSGASSATFGTNQAIRIDSNANTGYAIGVPSTGGIVGGYYVNGGANSYDGGFEYNGTTRTLFLRSAGSNNVVLDTAGNLGLGVTPSAWATVLPVLQANNASFTGYNNQAIVSSNWYYNAGNKYIANGYATQYSQSSGQHIWYNAASGTAGNAISFSQAMTLQASGGLSLGVTTDPGAGSIQLGSGAYVGTGIGTANTTGTYYGTNEVRLYTSAAERARIDSSGNLLVGTTTAAGKVTIEQSAFATGLYVNSASGAGGANIHHRVASTSSQFALFTYVSSDVGSITTNGTVTLYNTTSDERLKENIANADSSSAIIDSLQVRKFDWKSDGSHQRYGFVAQELVTVAPEAVYQPTDTEQMMAVDYSKLVPMLVKEIQSLRARVAQLETN